MDESGEPLPLHTNHPRHDTIGRVSKGLPTANPYRLRPSHNLTDKGPLSNDTPRGRPTLSDRTRLRLLILLGFGESGT